MKWRLFRATDGLADTPTAAVSVGPSGRVWIRHSQRPGVITAYDGYTMRTLAVPASTAYRVYEGPAGILWTLDDTGLLRFNGEDWEFHAVGEIRLEIETDPLRQVRQIPLLPLSPSRVLLLLSNRLMVYDAAAGRATLVRSISQTQFQRFIEMRASLDGGLWVSALDGVAKVEGPLVTVGPESRWREFQISASLGIEQLQRPFEGPANEVTTVAVDLTEGSRRALVRFDFEQWQVQQVPDELVRQAWPGWDGTTWAHTINELLRIEDRAVYREPLWVGQIKDVAREREGTFWLATSEGVVRFAPPLWRTPPGARAVDSLVQSMVQGQREEIWMATSEGLVRSEEGEWESIPWPEGFEADFRIADRLYQLPDGRLVVGAADRPWIWDPVEDAFTRLTHPEDREIRALGQFQTGALCVRSQEQTPDGMAIRLEVFDGSGFEEFALLPSDHGLGELNCFMISSSDEAWIGGSDAVGRMVAGVLQVFGLKEGYIPQRAFCLREVGSGRIWCGGSVGIQEFNGREWNPVHTGIDRVHAMTAARDGRIWVAAASGIYSHDGTSWIRNGLEEGLPSQTVYDVFQDRRGRIWAGTTLGVSRYHPEADAEAPFVFEPELIESDGLAAGEGVAFAFSASDRWQQTARHRLLYSYRVDEGPWSPFQEAAARTFRNVGAGQHRIGVRAMDRNWNQSASPAYLDFTVVVPWYRESRIIASLVVGLLAALFFAALAVNRHRRLVKSYAEVERIVAVRTQELEKAQQELFQSQKMRALGTLAAGIAHDFNNILSIIKGSVQIIEKNPADVDKVLTRTTRIKTVVEQGAGIVRSMLGLSRASPSDYGVCNLNQVLQETLRILSDRLSPELDVRVESDPDVTEIRCSQQLLQQMLVNLILNASDASNGSGTVILRSRAGGPPPSATVILEPASNEGLLSVAVQDFGHGIAGDILPRIFEPFFTTKAFSSRRGTGLGLSMVYQLAKGLGCGIAVESAVGKGTTFTVMIPYERPVESPSSSIQP